MHNMISTLQQERCHLIMQNVYDRNYEVVTFARLCNKTKRRQSARSI